MVEYLLILTFVEYLIILLCSLVSVYHFGFVLYWTAYRKLCFGMNASMKFFIAIEFAISCSTLIYSVCFVFYWRHDSNIYNAYVIFWTGSTTIILLVVEPIVACFLGIERCICLLFPFRDSKLWSQTILILTWITIGIYSSIIFVSNILRAFPSTAQTDCRSLACLTRDSTGQWYNTLRYSTSITSVIIGIVLIRLFHTTHAILLKNTRLVVITLILAILFDFIPHFISFFFSTFFNVYLTQVIGPYSTLASSINTFACGMVYFRSFYKSVREVTVLISVK